MLLTYTIDENVKKNCC